MDDHEKHKLDAGVIDRVLEASDQLLSERVARYVLERAARIVRDRLDTYAKQTTGFDPLSAASMDAREGEADSIFHELSGLDPATLAREAREGKG